MKQNLHPEYHEVLVHCACGETWTTRSTKKELRLEICSQCHPFFTGKQKLVDSAGRVERFRQPLREEDVRLAGVDLIVARPPSPASLPSASRATSSRPWRRAAG